MLTDGSFLAATRTRTRVCTAVQGQEGRYVGREASNTFFNAVQAMSRRSRSYDRHRSRSRGRYRSRSRSRSHGRDDPYRGRRPPNIRGMVSLKVDNLSYRITPEELKPIFEHYGDVGDIYIPRDRFTKESRGFAFVRFFDRRDAEDAMDKMDGYVLDGREMRVQTARYGRPTEPPHIRYGRAYIPNNRYFYLAELNCTCRL